MMAEKRKLFFSFLFFFHAALMCRSFDPKMGPIARVLWACLPELLHVGAVLLIVALMVAITGAALFGDRAASFSTFSGVATNLTAASLMSSLTMMGSLTVMSSLLTIT